MIYPKLGHNQGSAIPAVLVGASILSLMILASASLINISNKDQMRTQILNDYNQKASEISLNLSGARTCLATLSGSVQSANWTSLTSAGGLSVPSLQLPLQGGQVSDIVTVGRVYGQLLIESLNLRVEGAIGNIDIGGEPHTLHRARLLLQTGNQNEEVMAWAGRKTRNFSIMMTVRNSDRALASCYEDLANSATLQATCESLGGVFTPGNGSTAGRCSALDPLNQDLQQESQNRLAAITDSAQRLSRGVQDSSQQIRTMQATLSGLVQEEAVRAQALSVSLTASDQRLDQVNRDLASTNQGLNRTNRTILETQIELAQTTNRLQSRLDALNFDLRRSNQQIQTQVNEINQTLSDLRALQNRLTGLNTNQDALGADQGALQNDLNNLVPALQNAQNQLNNALGNARFLESLLPGLEYNIFLIQTRMQAVSYCPAGRNQYGNCIQPRLPETCENGNCTF